MVSQKELDELQEKYDDAFYLICELLSNLKTMKLVLEKREPEHWTLNYVDMGIYDINTSHLLDDKLEKIKFPIPNKVEELEEQLNKVRGHLGKFPKMGFTKHRISRTGYAIGVKFSGSFEDWLAELKEFLGGDQINP